jgi:hypothetical protein
MTPRPPGTAHRTPLLAAALTLFLLGSNYCLVSAAAGGRMACTPVPVPAAPAQSSHCCDEVPAQTPAVPSSGATAPCCILLAPAPQPAGIEAAAPIASVITPPDDAPLSRIEAAGSWLLTLADTGPPLLRERAPSPTRAPPLA